MTSEEARSKALDRIRGIEESLARRSRARGVPAQRRLQSEQSLPRIPYLPPRRIVPARSLLVGSILDDFSVRGFEHEWSLVELTPNNWRGALKKHWFDVLFVESVWRGKDGSWAGKMAMLKDPQSGPSDDLKSLVADFRRRGIPTVFWNKEDPPNYDLYINTAKLFDHVFTVAEECIPRYRVDLGHDRVYALPFAAQPKIHNPVSVGARKRDVAFAGTYFARKHPARQEQMSIVLDAARGFDLEIFDRQMSDNTKYQWPERFVPYIVGSLSYDKVLLAYKLYKVFVNVNSVPASSSMCARRIFELSASNTPIVSGVSPAITRFFGEDIMQAATEGEARTAFRLLLTSESYRARLAHRALRTVMRHHTTSHRVEEILRRVGLDDIPIRSSPLVSAVAPSNRPAMVKQTIAAVARQSYRPIELVLVAHGYSPDEGELRDYAKSLGLEDVLTLEVDADVPLGEVLNRAFAIANGKYIWKADDDDYYGPEFLHDLLDAFLYTDAEVVGKAAHYAFIEGQNMTVIRNRAKEHSYVSHVHGATMVVSREIMREASFPAIPQGSDTGFQRAVLGAGARIYSADRFNFAYVRRADPSMHTWVVDDAQLLANGEFAFIGFPKEQVIL